MARRPQDDPLGSKPMLPPPNGEGADRAAALFQRLVRMQRDGEAGPVSIPTARDAHAAGALPGPDDFAAGRRYDLALAVFAEITPPPGETPPLQPADVNVGPPDETSDGVVESPQADVRAESGAGQTDFARAQVVARGPDPVSDLEQTRELDVALPADDVAELMEYARVEAAESTVPTSVGPAQDLEEPNLPADPRGPVASERPPPGAPMIRPPVRRPAPRAAAVSKEVLQKAASGARLIAEPDGSTSFDITFTDDVFDELSCRITVAGDEILAVFTVPDQNLRRLLEAESGRLRGQLEGRGLRVGEIRVEVREP